MDRRVVLITGASTGIGRATAQLLAARPDFQVFGTSRQPENVSDPGFDLLRLDVRDDDSVGACVAAVLDRAGRLDVLINNAGYAILGAAEETTVDDARRLFDTNFFGALRLVNAALPIMRAQRSGHIVNVSSLAGIIGAPYLGLYCAAKFALEGYSEALRYEVRRFGVRVSLVEPGDIRTGIVHEKPGNPIPDYDGVRERVVGIHEYNVHTGPDPDIVARKIWESITSPSPRLRYPVGPEAWVTLAKRLLPWSLIEWGVRRAYRLDDDS